MESRRRIGPLTDGVGNLITATRLGGSRAVGDVWRAVPPVAALAWIADLFRRCRPDGGVLRRSG